MPFCVFDHCSVGIFSPLDLDLREFTPQKKAQIDSSNLKLTTSQGASRKLFPIHNNLIDQEVPEEDSINEEASKGNFSDQVASQDDLIYRESSPSNLVDEEASHANQIDPKASTSREGPSKEELLAKLQALEEELKVLKNKERKGAVNDKHDSDVYTFSCMVDDCKQLFSTGTGLWKHVKEKHGNIKLPKVPCSYCGKAVGWYLKHVRKYHADIVVIKCEVCGKVYEKGENIKAHRKNCMKCPKCGLDGKRKDRLLKHIKVCDKSSEIGVVEENVTIEEVHKGSTDEETDTPAETQDVPASKIGPEIGKIKGHDGNKNVDEDSTKEEDSKADEIDPIFGEAKGNVEEKNVDDSDSQESNIEIEVQDLCAGETVDKTRKTGDNEGEMDVKVSESDDETNVEVIQPGYDFGEVDDVFKV